MVDDYKQIVSFGDGSAAAHINFQQLWQYGQDLSKFSSDRIPPWRITWQEGLSLVEKLLAFGRWWERKHHFSLRM